MDKDLLKIYTHSKNEIILYDHDHIPSGIGCSRNGSRIMCNGSRDKWELSSWSDSNGIPVTDFKKIQELNAKLVSMENE